MSLIKVSRCNKSKQFKYHFMFDYTPNSNSCRMIVTECFHKTLFNIPLYAGLIQEYLKYNLLENTHGCVFSIIAPEWNTWSHSVNVWNEWACAWIFYYISWYLIWIFWELFSFILMNWDWRNSEVLHKVCLIFLNNHELKEARIKTILIILFLMKIKR